MPNLSVFSNHTVAYGLKLMSQSSNHDQIINQQSRHIKSNIANHVTFLFSSNKSTAISFRKFQRKIQRKFHSIDSIVLPKQV